MNYKFDCRLFNGYKPCRHKRACTGCDYYDPVHKRIAIVSLEAMGAVLRSTCLLPAIKREYPKSHITWITLPNTRDLLLENPYIDRLLTFDASLSPALEHLEFDIVMGVDKSLRAGGIVERLKAKEKKGFGLSPQGFIRPLTPEADYQYQLGLDDELKFYKNQKTETQQITETMGLKWKRDPYILQLTASEKQEVSLRRQAMESRVQGETGVVAKGVIGYNTGCSYLFPFKKFTVPRSIEIIRMWRESFPEHIVALLGGPEDTQRQKEIKAAFAEDPFVVDTPTTGGLRSGVLWMDAADVVLSGCSLGMHIAIALGKQVVAWFGVSCIQEIDLYDKGIKLQAQVSCSPCWKTTCQEPVKCFDQVPARVVVDAFEKLLRPTP